MSKITSVEQHQQQEFVGGSSNSEHHCKDHSVSFESKESLDVHLRYHNENLFNQWNNQAQQEESNNNNSKAGNHNNSNHMVVNRESVSAPADSSEPLSRPPSEGTSSSSQQQPTPTSQGFQDYPTHMFNDNSYFMQNEPSYILPHSFSPVNDDPQQGPGNFTRYHPYQHQQRFPQEDLANSVSCSSPHSKVQCDTCGAVYDDLLQLTEHTRSSHPTSPNAYPGQPQYQQIGSSPQHQMQRHQQPQMHTSPVHRNQQQPGFDFSGGSIIKTDMKPDSEEQAEILDLDSHKVQTHRYEENMIRAQHQQQQEIQMQMHHHAMQQQQRTASHSVSAMLNWSGQQIHDYHVGIPHMGPMGSTPPIPDQSQFLRGPQTPADVPRHGGSPVISSTQTFPSIPASGLIPQAQKPPLANQSWKSNEARRPKTYNCTACSKWFTSSGHLKRHYNTTLHKNAVKVSNQPDPANLPISVHHHPGRDAVHTRGGPRSPELSASGSPPNLMAGPSGEATRGLLRKPTTSSSSNSNSSESSGIQGILSQQQMASTTHMSNLGRNYPPPSPMGIHHPQLSAPAPQLGQRNLQMSSHQMGVLQPLNSDISNLQHPHTHLTSSSPMGQLHHQSSTSPMMGGSLSMSSPPPPMGGTSMPHQPSPNDLPPHVTTITNNLGLMDISSLTTTGNDQIVSMPLAQEMFSAFESFNDNQRPLPSFNNFGMNSEFNIFGQNQPQAINVGGPRPEENISPSGSSYNVTYDTYRNASVKYEELTPANLTHCVGLDGSILIKYETSQDQSSSSCSYEESQFQMEPNNNIPEEVPKEEVNPNIKKKKNTKSKKRVVKTATLNSDLCEQMKNGRVYCKLCDKYFAKTCYFTQHKKCFHSGEKPFKCGQCGKRFLEENVHDGHFEKHTGDKPHKCTICIKQFNHKTDLTRHMCIHTGKKPFSCDICNKAFIRKDHMLKHRLTHTKKANNSKVKLHLR